MTLHLSDVPELPEFLRPTPARLAVGPAPISPLGWKLLAGHMASILDGINSLTGGALPRAVRATWPMVAIGVVGVIVFTQWRHLFGE